MSGRLDNGYQVRPTLGGPYRPPTHRLSFAPEDIPRMRPARRSRADHLLNATIIAVGLVLLAAAILREVLP